MSYAKRTDIKVNIGEQAVELDDGTLVAVSCMQSTTSSRIQFTAIARAIDDAGDAIKDTSGQSITRTLLHSDVNVSRAADVARDCLRAVLGETPVTVAWGAQYLLDVSIRQAIALATIPTGAVDAAAAL